MLIRYLAIIFIFCFFSACESEVNKIDEAGRLNPVLPGDNPNPSVTKIGDSYYASTTSNEWSPLFPIYKSDDLVNWKLISYVFPGGAPDWAESNFFAPELSYDKNQKRLYAYYTARSKSTHKITIAVAVADSPEGPFTDYGPIEIDDFETIDAFEVRDEDGKLFVVYKKLDALEEPDVIYAQPISEDRKNVIGPKFALIRSDQQWENKITEGPDIFKRGDYYYLFYSGGDCCEVSCNYKIGVARARKLEGPWEKNPANPIMRDTKYWKCPGTGDVFQYRRDFYFLYHAYKVDGGDYIGREGLLEKVYWTDDDWPYFKLQDRLDSIDSRIDFRDDFRKALRPCWQWRATQQLSYATGDDGLMLSASNENDLLGSILGQPVKSMNFEVIATIDLTNSGPNVDGGILLIGATDNRFGATMAGVGISAGNDLISVWITSGHEKNIYEAVPSVNYGDLIKLKMRVEDGDLVRFFVSDDSKWDLIADSIDVSPYVPWGMGFRWGVTSSGADGEYVNIKSVELHHRTFK